MHILYFNGLGTGELRGREKPAIRFLENHGHQVTHGHVNWRLKRPFRDLLREKELQARKLLTEHGQLVIAGSSAGGSLAFNTLNALPNKHGAYAVSLCGRLRPGDLPFWDRRTLSTMAHRGTEQESMLFYESVRTCSINLNSMSKEDLARLRVVEQLADFVVPKSTMHDARIETTHVPVIGHGLGIAMAVLALPKIIDSLHEP